MGSKKKGGKMKNFGAQFVLVILFITLFSTFWIYAPETLANTVEDQPIKIGGIYSYTGLPEWMTGAQNAAQMAVDEENAAGGFDGKKFELVIRDDQIDPALAIKAAQELVVNEKVVALMGVSYSHVALAISNLSDQLKIPYVAGWCWKDNCTEKKEGFNFTIDEHPADTIDDLAKWAAHQKISRWAILIPALEHGFTAKKYFEIELKKNNPDAQIVVVRDYPLGKANFSAIIRVFQKMNVQGVFMTGAGSDLAQYIRETRLLGFDKAVHINPYLPYEGLMPLKSEAPQGWFVLGFPGPELKEPDYQKFMSLYESKFGSVPGLTVLISYITTKFTLEAIKKSKSSDPLKIREALKGLQIDTPVGRVLMNAKTRQSDLGYWYGITDVRDGKPILKDFFRSNGHN